MENKKKKKYTCEICGCKTNYTMNICEDCFDNEWEGYNKRNQKDLDWKWRVYRKTKKN